MTHVEFEPTIPSLRGRHLIHLAIVPLNTPHGVYFPLLIRYKHSIKPSLQFPFLFFLFGSLEGYDTDARMRISICLVFNSFTAGRFAFFFLITSEGPRGRHHDEQFLIALGTKLS